MNLPSSIEPRMTRSPPPTPTYSSPVQSERSHQKYGIASWSYDKRGVGKSGGVYKHDVDSAQFELLAADAIAGVKMLAKRPDIDTNRIGIWGISQAGWIIPIVAGDAWNFSA